MSALKKGSELPPYPGTLAKPLIVREADFWRFRWAGDCGPESALAMEFGQVREQGEGIYAELEVKYAPTSSNGSKPMVGHILGPVKVNLTGPQGRSQIVNALAGSPDTATALWQDGNSYALRWHDMIEMAYRQVVIEYREGNPTLNLVKDVSEQIEVKYLVDRLMPLGQTTVLYSDGGTGKSWLAKWIGIVVAMGIAIPPFTPRGCHPILYLDWEVDEIEARRRLGWVARGLGFDEADLDGRFMYRRMERSIADDLARIRRDVAKYGVGLTIIDSVVPASGGDPNDAKVASVAMQAIRSLHPATRLVLAHISKADARANADSGKESGVYGNAFYRNLGRSLWELKVDRVGGAYEVGLIHRKVNVGRLQDPFGLRYRFDDVKHEFLIEPLSITQNAALARAGGIDLEVRALLTERGEMTTKAIVESTHRSKPTVLAALKRLIDTGDALRVKGSGAGRGNLARFRLVTADDYVDGSTQQHGDDEVGVDDDEIDDDED